ncbi:O-antigen ligase family protein [Biomaibacter acetigenes]|nr:O-antigen ligase family protein [Biomaibacter acetigenes]
MFFDKEFLPTHMYTGVLFLAWVIYKGFILKEQRFFRSPMDFAALALVGAYFISLFVAVNIRSAVGELLKYINYFMAFYLVSDFARTRKDIKIILWAMALSAFGVAFIGIGAAAGTFTYNGAFVGGRINSTIQYPNTLAAYLTAAFMISTSLWATAGQRWQRGILSVVNYTLFLCFLFTLSRAAWLMFPVFFLILIVGMPGEYRMKALGYSMETFIAAVIASPGFGTAISAAQKSQAWMWYAAGAAIAVILFFAVEKISEHFALHIRPKVIITALIIFIILAGTGGYIALTTEASLTLSHTENEPESWKTAWYPVENVRPDTEYTVKVTVSSKPGAKEEQWGAALLVNSLDENKNSVRILNEYIKESLNGQVKEFTFTTRPDTKSLSIGFSNRFPGTAASFSNVQFYESGDKSTAQKITLAYKYIPQAISRRISSINIGEHSVQERLTFYRDALKIIKSHPIFGTGGGGWKSVYFAYQSYRYFTTEVHSFFLQLWVETGTIGLLVLISLWTFVLISGFKVMRSDAHSEIRGLAWGAMAGAVALGGHSAMDFNLSLGAVALYLWELFGIIKSSSYMANPQENKTSSTVAWPAWAYTAISCILIVSSFFLYQGYTYGQQAVGYIQQQNITKAKDAFEKASKYDPLTASFKADLAQLEDVIGRQTKDDELIKKAEQDRMTAIGLDRYNAKLQTQLGAYCLQNGKLPDGLLALEKASDLNPYNMEVWENLADAYEKVAEVYIRQGKKDEALNLTQKSRNIFDKISDLNMKSPKNAPEKLEITSNLMLYVYKAKLLAENIDDENYYKKLKDLVFASDFTVDADHDGIPDLWRTSNSEKGLLKADIIKKDYARLTNEGQGPSYIYTKQDISLKPQNFYTINIMASGDIPKDKLVFNVFTREGKNPQYQWKEINPTQQLSKMTATFLTTKDLKEGKQWLRLDIQGISQKQINIKNLEIWEE